MRAPKSAPAILAPGDAEMLAEAAVTYEGLPLEPFNAHRVYAAGAMGVRFLKFTPADWRSFFASNIYAEAAFDAAVVVFLCLQPTSVAIRALSEPKAVLAEALHWADAEGLHHHGSAKAAAAGYAFGTAIAGLFKNLAVQELAPEDTELGARRNPAKKKP